MHQPQIAPSLLFLEYINTAIVQLNPELSIIYMNAAAEDLFEISRQRANGQFIWRLINDQTEPQSIRQLLNETIKTQHPYTCRETTLQIGFKAKVVDYTISLLPDGTLLVEFQLLDRILKLSREEQYVQQHQTARHLIRSMAHEIKNPLGGIRGATQLLARSYPDAELAQYTEIIIHEVDRLKKLVDNMLGSRQLPNLQQVNIHQPISRVDSLIKVHHQYKVKIEHDFDLSLPTTVADSDQLIQVILNISINAIQAMTENPDFFMQNNTLPTLIFRTRVQRSVTINGVIHRSAIRVDIEDNGIGIPESIAESIFYPLVSGRAQGTGLGLSIAQHIILQHHGHIECESRPGKTVFSLYLPWETSNEHS